MKTINFYKLMILLIAVVFTSSCVQDDEFENPDTTIVAPNLEGSVLTIMAVNNLFEQEVASAANDQGVEPGDFNYDQVVAELRGTVKLALETETISYVEGYVISNDEGGNFFEEIILQNAASNPVRGVKVLVDVNPLFTSYERGRKVYVRLDGLSVGYDGGVLTLGIVNATSLEKIAESQLEEYLIRDIVIETIVPKPLTFAEFTDANTNLAISLTNVQFNRNEVLGDTPKTFAGEADDEFDGERALESCEGGSVIFSTSTFADFKSILLPQGRGSMNAILSKNFFGDAFNVVVNDPTDITFDNEDRCDPDTFDCTGPSGGGDSFFNENFENFDAIEDYVAAGWTNANVSGGSVVWIIDNFSNNNYAQISGFNSDEDTIDTWLVTPAINMDTTIEEELNFNIQAAYDNGTILSVLIATDFTGDVTTATWNQLDVIIPTGPSGGFGDFTPSGPINLSCIEGTAHIAFRYQGSDPTATTRYHIDEIVLSGN